MSDEDDGSDEVSDPGVAYAAASATQAADKLRRMRDKRVCVRCKIGKTFCDEGRPCRRCIRLGHENDCVDAPSKQPRPRGPGKAKRLLLDAMSNDVNGIRRPAQRAPTNGHASLSSPASSHMTSELGGHAATLAGMRDTMDPMIGAADAMSPSAFDTDLFSTNRTSEQHSDLYLEASSGATSSASGGDPLTLFSLTYSNHDRTPADVIASGVLTANYCQEVYKELVRWHERITLGTAAITAPMYILYCRHYIEMATHYNAVSPSVLASHRAFLLSNLPDTRMIREYLLDHPQPPANADDLSDRVTNLVYEKLPLAVVRLRQDNFILRPTFLNEHAQRLFGYAPHELADAGVAGMFFALILHPDSWVAVAVAAASAIVNKQEVFMTRARCVGRAAAGGDAAGGGARLGIDAAAAAGEMFDVVITCQMEYRSGPVPTAATIFAQVV